MSIQIIIIIFIIIIIVVHIIHSKVVTLTFTYHGLNGEHVARLHNSNCFVFWEINEYKNHHVVGEHVRTFRDVKRVRWQLCDYSLA